jgi:cytochrome P450
MLGGLFAGIDNSGKNTAWNLVYLAVNPQWKAKAFEEVKRAAAKYSSDKESPMVEQLSSLPLEAWETEFPFLDTVLTETIRLHLQGVQFRKNVSGKNVKVGDEIIPTGAYVVSTDGRVFLVDLVLMIGYTGLPQRRCSSRPSDLSKSSSMGSFSALRRKFSK